MRQLRERHSRTTPIIGYYSVSSERFSNPAQTTEHELTDYLTRHTGHSIPTLSNTTMSPSILHSEEPFHSHKVNGKATVEATDPPADRRYFPDGLKTSGQHPVLETAVYPYEAFPKEITGPTVWRKEDYQNQPDRWTHPFTDAEVSELGKAADDFIASGKPLTALERVSRLLSSVADKV